MFFSDDGLIKNSYHNCRECGSAILGLEAPSDSSEMNPGDFVLCSKCGDVTILDDNCKDIRHPNHDEQKEIEADFDLQLAIAGIKQRRKENKQFQKQHCPYCGIIIEQLTGHTRSIPDPGDLTICGNCESISVITENFSIRLPTTVELEMLNNDQIQSEISLTRKKMRKKTEP